MHETTSDAAVVKTSLRTMETAVGMAGPPEEEPVEHETGSDMPAGVSTVPCLTEENAGAHAARLAEQNFLNCWLRETSDWEVLSAEASPAGLSSPALASSGLSSSLSCVREIAKATGCERVIRLGLPRQNAEIFMGVRYFSPTQRHLFAGPARLSLGQGFAAPVDLATLSSLCLRELTLTGTGGGAPALFQERLLHSLRLTEKFLVQRAVEIEGLYGAAPLRFIESEQALLLGHQVHPTPKSRVEMGVLDVDAYSPELGTSFPLHWFRVRSGLLKGRSALPTPAHELVGNLLQVHSGSAASRAASASAAVTARTAEVLAYDQAGWGLLPLHPWQARLLLQRPAVRELVDRGDMRDLGLMGESFAPTSSVRTLYAENLPFMCKFSLSVRITNSLRVTLAKELDRAVEAACLWATDIGRIASVVAPTVRVLHDPAYLTLAPDGEVWDEFSVLLRENPWGKASREDVTALTTLVQDHPAGGKSRLASIVCALAKRTGRTVPDVARAWFGRYVSVAVLPLLRLFCEVGLCFEPHQQNTLLSLEDGWPASFLIRDSQGYFHREAAHAYLCRHLPGVGEATESIFPEDLAAERLTYYVFVNGVLGMVNAFGTAGLIGEEVLLADLRTELTALRAGGTRYPATIVDRLLDMERLPCKGNLRTRFHDMDELVGDIATQSVYVEIDNPFAQAGAGQDAKQCVPATVAAPGAPQPQKQQAETGEEQ